MAEQIEAGVVWVNSYNLFDPSVPYGGYKESGYGRDQSRESIEAFTQVKAIWVSTDE